MTGVFTRRREKDTAGRNYVATKASGSVEAASQRMPKITRKPPVTRKKQKDSPLRF